MKRRILSAVMVSSAAMVLVACGQDQAPVEEAAAPPAEESRMLEQALEAAKDPVGETASKTKDAASEAAVSAIKRAESVHDRADKEAKEMIDQVKGFIAKDKEEMARELMDRLSAMKDSLSAALRAEIERLEAMFSDA
jgi:NADH dehydrogenase/NADH:ubiquinone oxidoreductase subunit G